jgi:hypothetical protein
MKRGCMQRNSRKEGPDVWQFRWSETRLDGKRLYHKKIVGTVEQYPDEDAARDTAPIPKDFWISNSMLGRRLENHSSGADGIEHVSEI